MSTARFREPIGWPLLPLPDANGALAWPDLARSVREQIQVLLSTQPGEQLMRPAFGAGLERLLRYCARSAFALERLEQLHEDQLVYRFPKPQPDGRTELHLTPLQLIERLAASRLWRF